MWLMWEGTKTGFYTKNNDGPLWLQWSAFEVTCYMNWSTCVLVPFLINFPHDSHANICGWNCLIWICHKSLGCIEVVSGTLDFLYIKLLMCQNTRLWRHLDGVDVNLCTFLATAFHVGQLSSAHFSYSVPGNVNMSHWLGSWMAAELFWTEWWWKNVLLCWECSCSLYMYSATLLCPLVCLLMIYPLRGLCCIK